MEGYDLIRRDRNRHGGGVCLYKRSSINIKDRTDLIHNEMEAICVEIIKPMSKPFPIIACYRPPDSDADKFFNTLEGILTKLDEEGKEIYMLGDLNCNLLSQTISHPHAFWKISANYINSRN